MEGGGFVSLDIAEFEKSGGELGGELRASVSYDVIWQSVMFENIVEEQVCRPFRCYIRRRWAEMSHFGESVYADEDGVLSFGFREFDDEVHGH